METTEIEIAGTKYLANIIKQDEKYLIFITGDIGMLQLDRYSRVLKSKGWDNITLFVQPNDVKMEEVKNPLAELVVIPDAIYAKLAAVKGLLYPATIRNLEIRKRFREMKVQKIKTGDAIENLMKEYPYLQFDSIRKIVHQSIIKKD